MVTSRNDKTFQFRGLSTDTKPTENIENGSLFIEMDTSKVYSFDKENKAWEILDISGGGGGGTTYTAGDGIDITNNKISVDNTIAKKTEIPDVSSFVTESEVNTKLGDYELKTDAFSGSYTDLTDKPELFDGAYDSLSGKPDLSVYAKSANLATVATSGNYNDLINIPTNTGGEVTIDSSSWSIKSWTSSGTSTIDGDKIWTANGTTYYSNGSSYFQLYLSGSNWYSKSWSGLDSLYGQYIWKDGTHTYYSNGTKQYELTSASTWTEKTWNGLTSFNGNNIWTDGTNIYYSSSSTQYVLNSETSTWTEKTWTGMTSFNGQYIWTDGENIYYSSSSTQRVLDKETSTWSTKKWTGLTSFFGNYIWSAGEMIYYSHTSDQFVLNKSSSTWTKMVWNFAINYGSYIWTKDNTIYYSSGSVIGSNSTHYEFSQKINTVEILATVASTGSYNDLKNKPTIPAAQVQANWNETSTSSKAYIQNKPTIQNIGIEDVTFTTAWAAKTWTNLTNFNSEYVWTDGENTYYSNGTIHKVLNKKTSTWDAKTWSGLTNFYGYNVWTNGTDIYYSSGTSHYVLNKSNSTWNSKSWSGVQTMKSFDGQYIWTDGTTIYYSDGSKNGMFDGTYWQQKYWPNLEYPNAKYIWTDGTTIYYSYGTTQYYLQYGSWTSKSWTTLSDFNGIDVWSDGTNVYYSNATAQYKLNGSQWTIVTWTGYSSFSGQYTWTDGTDYYYSNSTNQYSLKHSTYPATNLAKVAETGSYNDLKDTPEGTTVIANPTLVGTETTLTGLQVGNIKYVVGGSSGGSMYNHFFGVQTSDSKTYMFSLTCSVSTQMSKSDLITYLGSKNTIIPVWEISSTSTGYGVFSGCIMNYPGTDIMLLTSSTATPLNDITTTMWQDDVTSA